MGAALVNLETGVPSWVCQCKSDILSLQLGHSVTVLHKHFSWCDKGNIRLHCLHILPSLREFRFHATHH